jgi:hypothetical protein
MTDPQNDPVGVRATLSLVLRPAVSGRTLDSSNGAIALEHSWPVIATGGITGNEAAERSLWISSSYAATLFETLALS